MNSLVAPEGEGLMSVGAWWPRGSRSITELPQTWPGIEPGIRRMLLHRFPYALLYTLEPDHILVLAVKLHNRRPGYWRGR